MKLVIAALSLLAVNGIAFAGEPEPSSTPTTAVPADPPPVPPQTVPAAPQALGPQTPTTPGGQWVDTAQYGWLWMPYGSQYASVPEDDGMGDGDPYAYVYEPNAGWTWLAAPWLMGWGPYVTFGDGGGWGYGWFRGPWAWRGDGMGFGYRAGWGSDSYYRGGYGSRYGGRGWAGSFRGGHFGGHFGRAGGGFHGGGHW